MSKSWTTNRSSLKESIRKVVGIDLAASKIAVTYFDKDINEVKTRIFPNIITEGPDTFDDCDSTVSEFTVGDKVYTCGRPQSSRVCDNLLTTGVARLTDPAVRAVLTQYALTQLGMGGEKIFITASMPTSNYFLSNGARNAKFIKATMEALAYSVKINNKTPAIVDYLNGQGKTVYGIPQSEAEAAFLAASTSVDLKPILKINKGDVIDLMDIGYGTTDTTRIILNGDGKAVIVPEHSKSIQFAMQPIMVAYYENVMEALQNHEIASVRDVQLSQAQLYQAWLDGFIRIGKKAIIYLSKQKKDVLDKGMRKLQAEIKSQSIATGIQVRYHLASGGGSRQARKQLEKWYEGEMDFIENPEQACSIGNYISGLKQMLNIVRSKSGDKNFSLDDLRELTYE